MIPSDKIRDIVEAVDIAQVVGRYVSLKKAGRNLLGLCPFHQEKTPSFNVSPEKRIFHCFGCHAGGDVLRFLMRIENLSFIEAVRRLADMAGISLPADEYRPDPAARENSRIKNAAEAAARYMQKALLESPEAISYLISRGLAEDTVREHRLGFLPRDGWGLFNAVRDHASLALLGLAAKKGDRFVPRMNGRIMFPIPDNRGEIVAFGGRTMTGEQPKYINSPEHACFRKGEIFYCMEKSRAEIISTRSVIIVEGYLDYLLMYQAGAKETLATLGTAMTDYHVKRLRPLVERIYLVYDADAAGLKAARRAGKLAGEAGIDTRVVVLPAGMDPADFILDRGLDSFRRLQAEAESFFDFLVNAITMQVTDLKSRVLAADESASFLSGIADPVIKGEYRKKISERIGVSEEELERRASTVRPSPRRDFGASASQTRPGTDSLGTLPHYAAPSQPRPGTSAASQTRPDSAAGSQHRAGTADASKHRPGSGLNDGLTEKPEKPDGAEQVILRLVLTSPAWIERIKKELLPEDFTHRWVGDLVANITRETTPSSILGMISDNMVAGIVTGLAFDHELEDEVIAERAFRDSLKRLYSGRSKRILSALRHAEAEGNLDEVKRLQSMLALLKRGFDKDAEKRS